MHVMIFFCGRSITRMRTTKYRDLMAVRFYNELIINVIIIHLFPLPDSSMGNSPLVLPNCLSDQERHVFIHQELKVWGKNLPERI